MLYFKDFILLGLYHTGAWYNCLVSKEAEGAEQAELDNKRSPFRADLIISYLTIRLTLEGEEDLWGKGFAKGRVWAPKGELDLTLRYNPDLSRQKGWIVETRALPEDIKLDIEEYEVTFSEEIAQFLRAQRICGSDQGQGISLRQVRILPSSKAEEF